MESQLRKDAYCVAASDIAIMPKVGVLELKNNLGFKYIAVY